VFAELGYFRGTSLSSPKKKEKIFLSAVPFQGYSKSSPA